MYTHFTEIFLKMCINFFGNLCRRTTWTSKSIIDEPRIMIELEVLHYNIVPCFRKGEGQICSEIIYVRDSQ